MNENKQLESTLRDTQTNLLKLQQITLKQKKKIENLHRERKEQARANVQTQKLTETTTKTDTQQLPRPHVFEPTELQKLTPEQKTVILIAQEKELEKYRAMERSIEEANSILNVIQDQLPMLQSTLANVEGLTH